MGFLDSICCNKTTKLRNGPTLSLHAVVQVYRQLGIPGGNLAEIAAITLIYNTILTKPRSAMALRKAKKTLAAMSREGSIE